MEDTKRHDQDAIPSQSEEESPPCGPQQEDNALPQPPAISPEAAAVLDALSIASTPYLTCSRYNTITFINLLRVRPKNQSHLQPDQHVEDSAYEQLPNCTGCGSSKYMRAGVVSFQEKIEDERIAIKEFKRKRGPAAALIQWIARGFLGRLEYRRRKVERERYLRKINCAATRIQTRVRGMQARRHTLIERCLRVIKRMHPSIWTYALAARPDQPPVFWYDNPAERNVFFWNYREFVRRSGGRPTLIKVEANVLELTKRMLLREYVLVSRIQSRWRGLTTRPVFRELKRQTGWLRGIQQSPAIKVQQLFRGHTSYKKCSALKVKTQYSAQMEAHKREQRARADQDSTKACRSKLLAKYRLGFQVEATARMLAVPANDKVGVKKSKIRGEEEEVGPETHAHIHHSLKAAATVKSSPPVKALRQQLHALTIQEEDDASEQQDAIKRNRHPNSTKFHELKRKLEGTKSKL
ncbi:hypothetical protein FI667_g1134, partial [Globisporangium splendens]